MVRGMADMISFPRLPNVKMHHDCYEDLEKLIHDDEKPDFIAAYTLRINFLSQNIGKETLYHKSWFEVLKKVQGMRSIRFMKFRNLRILYMIEEEKAYLLLAFEEHQGHKNTEYAKYVDSALKRLKERKGSNENRIC